MASTSARRRLATISGVTFTDTDYPAVAVIGNGSSATVEHSLVQRCGMKWPGVRVDDAATATLRATRVQDCTPALRAGRNTHVDLENCALAGSSGALVTAEGGQVMMSGVELEGTELDTAVTVEGRAAISANGCTFNGRPIPDGPVGDAGGLKRLDAMIGLAGVKTEMRRLMDFAIVQQQRREQGMSTSATTLHLVFTGNPGTGKTTVARIVGEIYANAGLLELRPRRRGGQGQLVGEYIGETAAKTTAKIKEALGGVLFIDEAYSLAADKGTGNDFGGEAIDTLLKAMEDHRDQLAVDRRRLHRADAQVHRRQPRPAVTIHPVRRVRGLSRPPSCADPGRVFHRDGSVVEPEAGEKLTKVIADLHRDRSATFGNGRAMRDLFEKITERQAQRLGHRPGRRSARAAANHRRRRARGPGRGGRRRRGAAGRARRHDRP